jgi:hypothetical protein
MHFSSSITNRDQESFLGAVYRKDLNSIELIINTRVFDFNCLDYKGKGALHFLGYNYNREIAYLLIKEYKLNLDIADTHNNTPLHYCSHYYKHEMLTLLLREGANPNKGNICKETPLHIAIKKSFISGVVDLIEGGALLTIKDASNKTPLDYLEDKADLAQVIEQLPLFVDGSINNIQKLVNHISFKQFQSFYKPQLKEYFFLKIGITKDFCSSVEKLILSKDEAFKDIWLFQCGICHMPEHVDTGNNLLSLPKEILREIGGYLTIDDIKYPSSTTQDFCDYSGNVTNSMFFDEMLNIEC